VKIIEKGPLKGPFRIFLVEAMGVEPMSALLQTPSATCLVFIYTHFATLKTGVEQKSQFSGTNQATKLKILA